jgi:hypothetical protein
MSTFFVVCFLVGLGLSVFAFAGGLRHGHGHHHGPRLKLKTRSRASLLNMAAITAFLVWFGGGGLLMQRLTPWSSPWIAIVATAIGLAGGSFINNVIHALARREWTAEPLTMIGTIAKTTVSIRGAGGTGEIVFTHQGTRQVAGARSDSGRAIGKGAEVVVTRYEKGIAYVATWEELTPRGIQEESSC